MRVRLGSTTLCKDLTPTRSYETFYLWTEYGVVDTTAQIVHSYRATADPDILDIETHMFQGSLSKVYHSEPMIVTWYSSQMWQEGSRVFEILRTNSPAQNPPPNKCGSPKS